MMKKKSDYRLNIKKDFGQYNKVISLAGAVDYDFPPNYLSSQKEFEIFVFMNVLSGNHADKLPENLLKDYDVIREELQSKIQTSVLSKSFKTTYEGETAYHEVTAGLIDKPFKVFLENFDPARDWGKNLAGYIGGELAVDEVNKKNEAVLGRERMVLSTPWYALGTPDLDMSKYENTQYDKNSVKVNWFVTKSGNSSVFLDVGYLRFAKYVSEDTENDPEKTIAIFNSIHRINAGCIAHILPQFMQSMLVLKSLRDMFSSYIRRYQTIASRWNV